MLRLSKKAEYALIATLYMAEKKNGELTTTRELADQFEIPMDILSKVLQKLVRKRLIISVQGVKGGYRLARPSDEITLAEVIEAFNGPIQLVKCVGKQPVCTCKQYPVCNIRHPMERIQHHIDHLLQNLTLEALLNEKSETEISTSIF